ncbi:MAG: M48 family metalloprotease [Pararhodobacter sp.]|nr:M48 family metalloprotease [Pararhodobacter sp.]
MTPASRHRLRNLAQSALLLAGMGLIVWLVVGWLAGPGWTLALVAATLAGLALAPSVPRRLLLSAYRARPLAAWEFPRGAALIEALAERARLPRPPELWYVPSRLPNAFAIGHSGDSVICISDGLLRLLGPRELAAVLAHEMAHIAHRDLWVMGLADGLTRLVSIASWAGMLLLIIYLPLVLAGAADFPWHVPLVLIFAPTLMALLQLALSRNREFDADLGAVTLTGDPAALASALSKLEARGGRMWEEILLPGRRIPEPSLLRTHPPSEERIARLRQLALPQAPHPLPGAPHTRLQMPTPPRPRFHRSGMWF